jgi:Arc/MetJ-type ribon-helix-helix transcriptional regulator
MHQVSVPLNRQQLELIDRTLTRGLASSRAELLKLALRETLARQQAAGQGRPAEPHR